MPKLYLVPNSISEVSPNLLPDYITQAIKDVRVFFVEEPKSSRRLLKSLNAEFPLADCRFFDLNEHSNPKEIQEYVKILKEGDSAIISEAGCPCVADPGADLVFLAHQNNIEIIPLVGPSSILLALMASGLSGQNFAFNGYLPKGRPERTQKIKMLEERSFKEKQTQVFMEAPYRNQSMLEDILALAQDKTNLCIACDITGPHQMIKTMSVKEWKKNPPNIDKKPALFLLYLSIFLVFFIVSFFGPVSFAAIPSASQQMGGQKRARQMQEESENLQNQVEQPITKSKKEKPSQETPEGPTAQRVLVKSINVTGVTVFKITEIKAITSQYENKELTFKEIQNIADLITDLYRKKGYVTCTSSALFRHNFFLQQEALRLN